MIESKRKFWGVPIEVYSTMTESATAIFEADSIEEAEGKYHSEVPIDIIYSGDYDVEYKYDVYEENDPYNKPDLLDNKIEEIQCILKKEQNNA